MSEPWIVVALVGITTVALKGAGPMLLADRELPEEVLRVIRLLAPTLLIALIVVQTFGEGRELVIDARAAGLAAAAVALSVRAPTLVAVLLAAATAALVRHTVGG